MAEAPAGSGPYALGEVVMVQYTDKYYEGKIQKAEYRPDQTGGQWYYLVHYTGYNKKYDEWVEQSGLQKAPAMPTPAPAKKPSKKETKAPKSKKAQEAVEAGPIQFEVKIPAVLQIKMLDDWDAIKKEGKLLPLPRKPNIHEVLQLYVREVYERNNNADIEDDLCCGLKLYFDKALPYRLLYPQEWEQADRALTSGKTPCSVYGAEHLMRLFFLLPDLLPTADMPREQIVTLQTRLQGVLQYLVAHKEKYFLSKSEYKVARVSAAQRKAVEAAAAAAVAAAAGGDVYMLGT